MTDTLIIRLLNAAEKLTWDKLSQTSITRCFMQSWAWADFKELEGYQTYRYGIFHDRVLVGGCIIYFYPYLNRPNILLAPGAPIFREQEYQEAALKLIIEQAEILALELGAIALRIEPLWSEKTVYLQEFKRSPADLLPSETLLVNLCQSEAELLAAMKPKGRYNLRLSWRYGVTTEFTSNPQNIPDFYDLFWQTVKRQQFFGEPYSFFINLCQSLFKANMAEIGFAKWQGETLVAIIIIYWGDRTTYLYGGSCDRNRHVMPAYALHWAAIQRAKNRGCKYYDFYGFTNNPKHNYANFSRFKSQFGGQIIKTIGAQDYVFYDRLAQPLIQLIAKLL